MEKNEDGTYKINDFFAGADKKCFAYDGDNGQKLMTSMFKLSLIDPTLSFSPI